MYKPLSISLPPYHDSDLQLFSDENADYITYKNYNIAILYSPKAAGLGEQISLGPDVFIPVCTPEIANIAWRTGENITVNETATVRWDH